MAFRDDVDRVRVAPEFLEQLPRNSQSSFSWLVGVRVRTDRDRLTDIRFLFPFANQAACRVRFVKYAGFEIETGGKVEIAMAGPRITVNAPMFAALVRIDRTIEGHVGRVVVADDFVRPHRREYGLGRRGGQPCGFLVVEFHGSCFEPAVGLRDGATAFVMRRGHARIPVCLYSYRG